MKKGNLKYTFFSLGIRYLRLWYAHQAYRALGLIE